VPKTSTDLQGGVGKTWERPLAPASSRPGDGGSSLIDAPGADGPLITRVQLDETLSQVVDVVLTVATDGTIGYVSPAVRNLLGWVTTCSSS
jgi:hypothetical protein